MVRWSSVRNACSGLCQCSSCQKASMTLFLLKPHPAVYRELIQSDGIIPYPNTGGVIHRLAIAALTPHRPSSPTPLAFMGRRWGRYHPGKSPPVLGYPLNRHLIPRHIVINEVAQTVITASSSISAAPMPIVIAPMTCCVRFSDSGCVLQHTQRAYADPNFSRRAMHADLHKMPGKGDCWYSLLSVPNSMLSSAVSLRLRWPHVAWRFGYRW